LGFREKGLKSAVILPLGYRDAANDWNANLKKVRKPMNEFIHVLN
jgi:nitroreductase